MRLTHYSILCSVVITAIGFVYAGYERYRGKACEVCERTAEIEWAHEFPQSLFADKINDPDNGHTLCRDCHSFFHFQKFPTYWSDDMDGIIEKVKASRCSMKDGKKAPYEVVK